MLNNATDTELLVLAVAAGNCFGVLIGASVALLT